MAVRYISVTPVTNLFKPATRAFGDIAIVGAADAAATGPKKKPIPVTNPDSVSDKSNPAGKDKPVDDARGFRVTSDESVRKAFEQTPGPTTVWAVRTDPAEAANAFANALAEVAKLDVQIVTLANTPLKSAAAGTERDRGALQPRQYSFQQREATARSESGWRCSEGRDRPDRHHRQHVQCADGHGRAQVRPRTRPLLWRARSPAMSLTSPFCSSRSVYRWTVCSAIRKSTRFNTARVNWLTDPSLIPGKGLFMGEGYTLGADIPYIDIIRTIDDISFRLKAQLIRSIGDLRVSRSGLRALVSQMTAVLEPLKQREVIEGYDVFLPLLVLLDKDPAASPTPSCSRSITPRTPGPWMRSSRWTTPARSIGLNITLKFE